MSSIGKHLYQAGLGTSSAFAEDLEQDDSWGEEVALPHAEIASWTT